MSKMKQDYALELPMAPTGITVIIVGLGVAGLTAAIECHRKGHTVIGFEKAEKSRQIGDVFGISSNGALVIDQWGNGVVAEQLDSIRGVPDSTDMHNSAGELLQKNPTFGVRPGEGYLVNRAEAVEVFYQHAKKLGLDLRFGITVSEYWETEHEAGVIANEEKVNGDCVIACDGIHSKARPIITGDSAGPKKTGSATYRASFDSDCVGKDPDAQWLLDGRGKTDKLNYFIGENILIIIGTMKYGKEIFWSCVHKSFHDVSEPWLQVSDVKHVLDYIEDWPFAKQLQSVIGKTPHGKCYDHLVLSMEPIDRFVSRKGRLMVIGDAAHPFLPTTGQGASQAIEDGAVVAICLEKAGKERVTLGFRMFEKLRQKRISLIQKSGLKILQNLHRAQFDTENQNENPNTISRPLWIHGHNCQRHTYEEWPKALNAVITGGKYIPTNIPADGIYRLVDEGKNISSAILTERGN
ncbi:hypothetical protein N7520_008521 [Penicillium odoratum]|uniref:uncharacterized protein n=1 Tax=Penicillium odoratum TaxID=1167516 RepID=UPI0025471ED3|nr:uncharacterized protein N7520_008521 [Penicillium odoratum]KAJ5751604.1 hypothetical protein N7520_008521 [Penicillium odoratum]